MARSFVTLVLVASLLMAYASAQDASAAAAGGVPSYEECRKRLDDAGGEATIRSTLQGACVKDGTLDETACCDAVKGIASAAGGCECNPQVWGEVQSTAAGAGVEGVNADTISTFISTCAGQGLKVAGYGC